jgi:hypothetical protein
MDLQMDREEVAIIIPADVVVVRVVRLKQAVVVEEADSKLAEAAVGVLWEPQVVLETLPAEEEVAAAVLLLCRVL